LVQHVAIAQQFLPFVRLDGYYVVSDIAGVPDLFGLIRPTFAAFARGRRTLGPLGDLTPRARAIVVAWLITTVPSLGGLTVLLVVKLPSLLAEAWASLRAQLAMVAGSMGEGDLIAVFFHTLQVVILAVPFAGLTGVVWRVVSCRRRSPAPAVERASRTTAAEPLIWSRPMIAGTFLLVAVACVLSRSANRQRRTPGR
jgi:putative peptide zinc metalloprotease protein